MARRLTYPVRTHKGVTFHYFDKAAAEEAQKKENMLMHMSAEERAAYKAAEAEKQKNEFDALMEEFRQMSAKEVSAC